jgi:nitrogen fixation NifU-like protein
MKKIYTERVIRHFKNPRNRGELKDYDSVAEKGNPICDDIIWMYIKVDNDKIVDIGWETTGCIAAIVSSSITSELAKGKKLEEIEKLTKEDVLKSLGKLPPVKVHCSEMAVEALKEAIKKYREKHKKKKSK